MRCWNEDALSWKTYKGIADDGEIVLWTTQKQENGRISLCEWSLADSDIVKLQFGWHTFSKFILPLHMIIRQFV